MVTQTPLACQRRALSWRRTYRTFPHEPREAVGIANREEVQQEILDAAERLAKETGPAADQAASYAERIPELAQAWEILETATKRSRGSKTRELVTF